jgi:hypothetical protein
MSVNPSRYAYPSRLQVQMAAIQYVREYIDVNQLHELEPDQVCQIKVNSVFAAEIFNLGERIIVDDVTHHDVFFLHSPDLPNMSIRDVLNALGYDNYYIDGFWSLINMSQENVLDSPVHRAPLFQISIRVINVPNAN